jgi:hypothetical protein
VALDAVQGHLHVGQRGSIEILVEGPGIKGRAVATIQVVASRAIAKTAMAM